MASYLYLILLNIILGSLLLALGAVLALLPFAPGLLDVLVQGSLDAPWAVTLLGGIIVLIALLIIFWSIPLLFRGKFRIIRGALKVWIHDKVIEEELKRTFERDNEGAVSGVSVTCPKKRLHISVTARYDSKEEFLKDIEEKIRSTLASGFGYYDDFTLTLFPENSGK